MAKEIWNEGRVVGYSAYDIYVKQHLASQPDGTPPATESEWLSASLASGNSLLAKIPNITQDDSAHSYMDFVVPADSRLGAANTIVATFFDGDAHFPSNTGVNKGLQYYVNGTNRGNSNIWADKVISYGELIKNDNSASPSDDGSTIPVETLQNWDSNKKKKLTDYMRIVDGIVIQPGEWSDTESGSPKKDEFQNLSERCIIRLHIRGKITKNPLVLFTGFTVRSVLSGTSILGSATTPEKREDETGFLGYVAPEDGDFLGPSLYPWANKIIFSVPSSFIAYFDIGKYERRLPSSTTNKMISDTPAIDMNKGSNTESNGNTAIDPHWFYSNSNSWASSKLPAGFRNNIVQYNVVDFTTAGDGTPVLTVYEKKAAYPPALYGTFVKASGDNYLCPLDCVAPGTIKMFIDADGNTMIDYENTFPGTVSMSKDSSTGEISTIVQGQKKPVAGLDIEPFGNSYATVVKVGNRTVKSLAVSPLGTGGSDPTKYETSGTSGNITPSNGKFNWSHLTDALKNNKSVDVLRNGIRADESTGVRISGSGPYIISFVDDDGEGHPVVPVPSTKEIIINPGDGIDIEKDETDSSITYKIINTAPNNPMGISYHWISSDSSAIKLILRANFCGAKATAEITPDGEYKGYLTEAEYLKGVRLGVNCGSLTKKSNGLYKGIMYFKIDFKGERGGVGTHLANKNLSGGNASSLQFQFLHSASTETRRKQASIISVRFNDKVVDGNNIWGNLNSRQAYWNSYKNSLWNVSEVYKDGGKFKTRDPGASFFPALTMWDPSDSQNPYGDSNYFTLYASSYYDGYNDQFDRWVGKGGHIFSRWLNMNVEWCCSVDNVNKSAILAL